MSTDKIFENILQRRLNNENVQQLAFDFHVMLANYIINTCQKIREKNKIANVVLSGGVFQNTLLLKLTNDRLQKYGFNVMQHKMIPPNDGGIALGQALVAAYYVTT